MKELRRLHLWVPELSGVGGIQQYSRTLLRGLAELLPEAEIRVLSKNDSREALPAQGNISFRSTGNGYAFSRTARFAALLAGQTLTQRPGLVILTHLHFAPVAHALKKLTGLRYWVAAHGMEAWAGFPVAMQRALAAAEKILPVSAHTRERLLALKYLNPERCVVLPNAVHGEVFFPTAKPAHLLRRYGLNPQHKILLTVARLDAADSYKGHERVIEALPKIREIVPNIHYILAGRGAENERMRRRARELGVDRNVTLTGFLPARDLRDHYNLCDLFVMPSAGEGFGIVYLEALACGRPALAGNQDGSREPLLNGELGLLVDPQQPGALVAAIADFLSGRHEPAHAYAPDYLRGRALESFGFAAFEARLKAVLNS